MSDSVQKEKHAPPTYVTQYHMTREPFGETIENDLYYAEPGRQQKLDILLHLTQYGNELVVVTGPIDSGKTTLLHQYLIKGLDTWSVAHIDAQTGIDERKLLQQLFHQMGLEFQGATHLGLFKRMQHHFDALQHSARQAVMLVDNAELLPVTALKLIMEMAELTSADNKPLLRVILFGTNRLNENFDDPLLAQYDHVVRRNVELLPFDQEHTAHYILHRLSAANFSENKPFTDAVLHKIHKQSDGWPGRINHLAHNTLLETLPIGGINQDGASTFNIRHLATALVGIVAIGALLFFQDEISGLLTPQAGNTSGQPTSPSPIVEDTIEDAVNGADKPVVEATPEVATETLADDTFNDTAPADNDIVQTSPVARLTNTVTDKPNTFVDNTDNDTETAPIETASITETQTPAATTKALTETKAPPAVEPATHSELAEPTPTEPASQPKAKPVVSATSTPATIPTDLPGKRSVWIRQQNPAHYTLQLVAGNNLKTLRNYLSEHKPALTETKTTLAIYQTTRKGQPWYGLILQSFPSKQAAIDARSKLPEPIRKQQPWVRSFADVQKDLDIAAK